MAPACEGFTDSRQHILKIKVKVEPPGFPEARGLTGRFPSQVAGLTMRGGLDGQIQVTIAGLESIVRSLDLDRAMSQGSLGSTIGALDRLIPGLGQVARQNAAPGILAALRAMGRPATLDDKPATTLPLRFNDGQILLGPFPVGRVPPLF